MLHGKGSNGKSVFINALIALLGRENCSARSLHDLLSNRFAKSDLFAKCINAFADLSSDDLKDTANFKALTGGDMITAEKKFRPHSRSLTTLS